MKIIGRIWRGLGYLEGYGDHPGVGMFWIFCFMGAAAGASNKTITTPTGHFIGAAVGFLLMALFMGSILCWGAHDRAKEYDEGLERRRKALL